MRHFTYHVGKAVERVSIILGSGRFEVNDNYQCAACHDEVFLFECDDCQRAWIYELRNLNYSDAFERKINLTVGWLGLLTAAVAWLANNSLSLWEFGPFFESLNTLLSPYYLDTTTLLPPFLRYIYLWALLILFGACAVALWAVIAVPMFIMVMNPNGERHWRHMTPSAVCVAIVGGVLHVVLVLQGIAVLDLAFLTIPAVMGLQMLCSVLCMRKSEEGDIRIGEAEGVGKLV